MPSKLDYGQKHFLVLIDKDKVAINLLQDQ